MSFGKQRHLEYRLEEWENKVHLWAYATQVTKTQVQRLIKLKWLLRTANHLYHFTYYTSSEWQTRYYSEVYQYFAFKLLSYKYYCWFYHQNNGHFPLFLDKVVTSWFSSFCIFFFFFFLLQQLLRLTGYGTWAIPS